MGQINSQFALVVNSTDSYSDCWQPFFDLLKHYWPTFSGPIYLNSETGSFADRDLNIINTRVGYEGALRPPWGECLLRCLAQVREPIILYVQEDYFLRHNVDEATLTRLFEMMQRHTISHIQLMAMRSGGPYLPCDHELLWTIHQRANYRISLQAGLWRTERLRHYLRPTESAWEFERWGGRRAQQEVDSFYCQNIEHFRDREPIFPYTPTGIVKGRWYEPAVVELFARHRIDVDFTRRGFYRVTKWQALVQELRRRARRLYMTFPILPGSGGSAQARGS